MTTAAPLCALLTRKDAVTDANWLKRCSLVNGARDNKRRWLV